MNNFNIFKQTAKMVVFTVLAIAISRLTQGYFIPAFVVMGVWCAFSGKLGWALVFYVLMPFFVILNSGLSASGNTVAGVALRVGPLLMGVLLALTSRSRVGHHRLPLGFLIPFLGVAVISSIDGWAPLVSYMKLLNFSVFLIGLWLGTQNLQDRPRDVFLLRSFFLAMAVILIWGSILLIPVPRISYATSMRYALAEHGLAYAEDMFRAMQADGLTTLFCGVTNHSQALGPALACAVSYVLCDMLFIERRFTWPHTLLLGSSFPLFYMTRSRVALVALLFIFLVVFVYTARRVQLPLTVRQKLGKGMILGVFLLAAIAGVAQMRSGAMTNWVRKVDKGKSDRRTLGQALTESRMGLMEYSLFEFRRNPIIGSGFQVAEYTRDQVKQSKGLILSSPIEKGILPVMVLGETGILGELAFIFFLVAFWWVCSRRQYFVTLTIFSVFLMTNFGEATFFSPGGIGGILWMFSLVGGFTIDTTILFRRNIFNQWATMAAEEQRQRELDMARYGRGNEL